MIVKRILSKALTLVELPVKRTNWYRSQCLDLNNYPTNEWYRSHLERNFDIVNIGSSSALYAFDYECVGLKGFNWALQPQSMEYGFKILKNFFSVLGPKGIVTIPLCPFSGLSVREWTPSAERYCDILDASLIENFNDYSFAHSHPLLSKPKESIKRLIKDIPTCKYTPGCNNQEEFKADARRWIELWEKEFKIDSLSESLSQENREGMTKRQKLVSEIIDFCIERDLQPVIVTPPVHESLAQYFSNEFCSNYIYDFIEGVNLKDAPYIHWLNPINDCPVLFDSSDFKNSFFLNKKGAKKFTAEFIKYLSDNNILTNNKQ